MAASCEDPVALAHAGQARWSGRFTHVVHFFLLSLPLLMADLLGTRSPLSPSCACGVSAAVSHAMSLPAPVTECGWVCGCARGSRSMVSSTLKELDSIHFVCETGFSLRPGAGQLGYPSGRQTSGVCPLPSPALIFLFFMDARVQTLPAESSSQLMGNPQG